MSVHPLPLVSPPDPAIAPSVGAPARDRALLYLLVGAALLRAPFIWHGFGVHPDEWGVLRAGIETWLDGHVFISRPPGYPLNELMMGGLALLGGGPLCALAAAGASLGAVYYFERLARIHGVPHATWVAAAFAVHPWLWRSSTHSLDYVWGVLTLVTAAYYIERDRSTLAAVLCGIGLGFRPSSLLWCVPLWLRHLQRTRSWRSAWRFAALTGCVGTVALWPALVSAPHWAFRSASFSWLAPTLRRGMLFGYHLVEFWGHLPGVLVLTAAWWWNRHRRLTPADWTAPYVVLVVLFGALFWLHSDKCEYFLPALPACLLLIGRRLTVRWWQAVVVVFALNGLLTIRVGSWPRSGMVFTPGIDYGAVLKDIHHRRQAADEVTRLWNEMQQPNSVVLRPGLMTMEQLYVCTRLRRGADSQPRFRGTLIPALIHVSGDGRPPYLSLHPPDGRNGDGVTSWAALLNPATGSIAVTSWAPVTPDEAAGAVRKLKARRGAEQTR